MSLPILDYAGPPPAEPSVPADGVPFAVFALGAAAVLTTVATAKFVSSPATASVLVWVDALLGLVVPVCVLGAEPRPGRRVAACLFLIAVWGSALSLILRAT